MVKICLLLFRWQFKKMMWQIILILLNLSVLMELGVFIYEL